MRTRKTLYPQTKKLYSCELSWCPVCEGPMNMCPYECGRKTVQTLQGAHQISYRPGRCADPTCAGYPMRVKSAQWQQIAPLHVTYGFDVIAHIGWQRQAGYQTLAQIHQELGDRVLLCESQVRYLFQQQYLPLLACRERQYYDQLEQVAQQRGLILSLDGMAPEGGEPQLWVVREVQTGLTLRCGWLSLQDQPTFEAFLRPIADQGLTIAALLSDKQSGLRLALQSVFPGVPQALCQSHYLTNLAQPIAQADETMKVELRKAIRGQIGPPLRREKVEADGVLTCTGLLPSPLPEPEPETVPAPRPDPHVAEPAPSGDPLRSERNEMIQTLHQRVRYLLTLKGRPPFRLAGIEMFERLQEVNGCLDRLIAHQAHPDLIALRAGVQHGLDQVADQHRLLRQGADWLGRISSVLDPKLHPARSGAQVHVELLGCLQQIHTESQHQPLLTQWADHLQATTQRHESGLFHTYDIPGLPRTNNERESEFRDLNRRLLRTTAQKGATRRLLQRSGAWELIPRPASFADTLAALSQPDYEDFLQERQRVRQHRARFRGHTRSAKQSQRQLDQLLQRWSSLPPDDSFG